MRIYRMTATFGKLEHETLTLEPGLNIITAPNEWGKSTWCAFMAAMFYGLETRTKSTKTTLADKERYAPWSGSPMAGRIDLNWQGRDITIERCTKRRVPLGEFRAYETASGVPVEELNAYNCGQVLLGVEQSVFRRAGFIRQAELPVTQDEALRRRLNALVTTGDESGAADRLADSLKDLKNRCRYNRTGLLPQAEQERDALADKIEEYRQLEAQSGTLRSQLDEIKSWLTQLYNHQQALAYRQAEELAVKTAQAEQACGEAAEVLRSCEENCRDLPPRDQAVQSLREIRSFREQWNELQAEVRDLPAAPVEPQQQAPFVGMTPEEARKAAKEDGELYMDVISSKTPAMLIATGLFGMVAAGVLMLLKVGLFAGIAASVAAIALLWGVAELIMLKRQARALVQKYGTSKWKRWPDSIYAYEEAMAIHAEAMAEYNHHKDDLEMRQMMLIRRKEALCGEQEPDAVLDDWQQTAACWDAFENARREAKRSQDHYETLKAMVKPVEKPAMPDTLTRSEAETVQLLSDCAVEQQHLQNRLGQHQGRMAVLGDKAQLEQALAEKERRINKLEHTYAALTIAQETLEQARAELQRRFAPRITKRAQKLLSTMTDGRYHTLTMGTDFSLQAGAGQEEVLCDALWRSDGTLDQLYLSIRLAVAQELTPEAPVILDDAMVRFDDHRLAAALELLRELAREKQVICFTCQEREQKLAK